MDKNELIVITPSEKGARLDALLFHRFSGKSRNYFQNLITDGCVLKNGQKAKKSEKVKPGDEIDILFRASPEIDLTPEKIPLDILFEDEHILVINKPSGLVTHPAPGHWSHTFVNALIYHCQNNFQPLVANGNLRPGIVHRLDKETTGVLLAAKTEEAHRKLINLFALRSVDKEYLAITVGQTPSQFLSAPIARNPRSRKLMSVQTGGKAAQTNFTLLATNQKLSLVLVQPQTGRTHQIRVHLQYLKTPILGDDAYGFKNINKTYQATRSLLHAFKLKLPHPVFQTQLEFIAPIPEDIKFFIQQIKKNLPFLSDLGLL